MDTDSSYMALSASTLDDLVKPLKKEEYEHEIKRWLAWDKHSGRTLGIFKLECDGDGMIALCSKCYFVRGDKKKFSTKGMSKRHNAITWARFKQALHGNSDWAENRVFRMVAGWMTTYKQEKLGLSAYYDKRWVLPDGIHKSRSSFTWAAAEY